MTSDELKLAAEYNRGWQDGKHAKSADEWWLANAREDVVRKLREVKLDGGSHANLSAICKCAYYVDKWTPSACVGLRDELISLLGGNADKHTQAFVGYDVLGNERHKAVCNLRKLNLGVGDLLVNNQIRISDAIGAEFNEGDNFSKVMQDRLIYLLSGDDGTCPNDDGTCPNGVPNASITAELRGHIDEWCKAWQRQASSEDGIDPATLYGIADRIDEQFDRICEQQESVLQATIGQMCEERDRLQAAIDLKERALDAALAKLKDSIELPKDADGVPWRINDKFIYDGREVNVDSLRLYDDGEWSLENELYDYALDASDFRHAKHSPAESIVRDLTLGLITEKEAVKRIEELRNE